MDNNSVDLKKMESLEEINKGIEEINYKIKAIEGLIENVKSLCIQVSGYQNTIVDFSDFIYDFSDSSLNQVYCWQIDGENKLDSNMDTLKLNVEHIKDRVISIREDMSNLDGITEETSKYVKKINEVLAGDVVANEIISQSKDEVVVLSQSDVLNSINNTFDNNRVLNQQFSDAVSRGVYEELNKYISHEMGNLNGK